MTKGMHRSKPLQQRNTGRSPGRPKLEENSKKKRTIPDDVLRRLRELRSMRRSLTRAELEYIVQCFDNYAAQILVERTRWSGKNLVSIKRRLYRTTQSIDGYSAAGKFLALESCKEYFMELNKKRGFLEPTPLKWLMEKLDYISYRWNTFEESQLSQFRVAFSCPPRSSKSELLYAFCFRMLLEQPHLRIVYISNNQSNIKRASSIVRGYLRDCGVIFSSDINNATSFVIDQVPDHTIDGIVCGGSFSTYTSASIPQGISADLLIVDDLLSSTDEANSELRREKANESFLTNMIPRLTPCGCVVVVSTRYHVHDLLSIITHKDFPDKYEYMNIPAITINEKGQEVSYWEKFWSIDKLQRTRQTIGERTFQSLYMGNPRDVEGALFCACQRYSGQTPAGCQYVWGIDLAYSTKTKADYTSLCKMYYSTVTKLYYVEKIWRWRKNIDDTLKKTKEIVGNNTIYFAYGGTENAIITLAKNYGLNIEGKRTTTDKYTRALPMSANFNSILFHDSIPTDYLQEIENFDGDPSNHDDITDAVVTCFTNISGTQKRSYNDIKNDMSSLFSNFIDDDDD
jgi:phage terminase large subunit-like protein